MGLAASLVLFVFIVSVTLPVETQAQKTSTMNFSVSNAAPFVGTVLCTIPASFSEAVNYNVTCNATLTDANGYQDVAACNGTWFRATSQKAGSQDDNVRYSNASCKLDGGSGNNVNCNCWFPVRYFADGTVYWIGNITARDGSNTLGHNDSYPGVILTGFMGIQLPTSIVQWGTLVPGGTATTFNSANFTVANNTGNENQSIQVQGAAATMTCTPSPTGNPVGNIKYWTAMGAYTSGTVLTVSYAQLDLSSSNNNGWIKNRQMATPGTIENRTAFWAVQAASGINGTCVITVNQNVGVGTPAI